MAAWYRTVYLVLFIILGFSVQAGSAVLFSEDFQNVSSINQSAFDDVSHTGGVDRNLVVAQTEQENKVLRWTREDSYHYYVRTRKILKSSTNRYSISFNTRFDRTNVYQWQFLIDDPTHTEPYLTLHVPGIGDNADWGRLRYDTGNGVLFSMCQISTGWRKIRIDVDFNKQTADVYYDNMKVPVGVDLPLHNVPKTGEVLFTPAFIGVSSAKEGYFELDNFVITDLPPIPKQVQLAKSKPLVISSKLWKLQISSSNGSIINAHYSNKLYLLASNDVYKLESRKTEGFAREINDRVIGVAKKSNRIELKCKNPSLPGIIIHKSYGLAASGQFSKQVEFQSTGTEGFITWILRNDAPASVVKAVYPNSTVGFYRYQVNNRFVLPVQGMMIRRNGWDQNVFCDYLRNQQRCSSQVKYFRYNSDPVVRASFLASVPEYKELFADQKPGWIDTMLCDTMYLTSDTPAFLNQIAPLNATATIWFLNPPWGNWWSYSDPPKSLHPNPAAIPADMRSLAPNGRFSSYANMLFDINSDVYKQHPEMAVYDRDGKMMDSGIPSDSGGVSTYYTNIGRTETRSYWLDMYVEKVKNWKMDFFYSDGPGTFHEVQDWKCLDVVQSSDWLDYYAELRKRLRALSPEIAFFSNGILPYSNIGYIEWRDWFWQPLAGSDKWQSNAKSLLLYKASEPKDYLLVPTYGTNEAQPSISTYSIAYGWCGHGTSLQRLPWMAAALEYRYMRLIPDGVYPKWWLSGGNYEVYAFSKDANRIISVISHSDNKSEKIRLKPSALNLKPGRYLMRILAMNNPVNTSSTAFTETDCKYLQITNRDITISVPVNKSLLTSIIISPIPAIVENNGARLSETGIVSCYALEITRSVTKKGTNIPHEYSVKTNYPNIAVFFPDATAISSSSNSITTEPAKRNNMNGVRVKIRDMGKYILKLRYAN